MLWNTDKALSHRPGSGCHGSVHSRELPVWHVLSHMSADTSQQIYYCCPLKFRLMVEVGVAGDGREWVWGVGGEGLEAGGEVVSEERAGAGWGGRQGHGGGA